MLPPPVFAPLAVAFAVAALLVLPARASGQESKGPPASGPPNVLMILVDDLKPALGCYGDAVAQTPHMDALAARGMRFDAAYCNQAVCAPSRFTLMLGSHSTSTGLYGLGSHLRKALPDAVTLPQHFATAGYRTESLGKVFHVGHGNMGDPESFMVPHFKDKVIEYVAPENVGGPITREEALFGNVMLGRIGQLPRGAAYESPDVPDDAYADGRVTAETVRRLGEAKTRREAEGTPFFIACGLARPHMPFSVPQRYWDLYDPDELPAAEYVEAPDGTPRVAMKRGGEINAYKPIPEGGDPEPGSELAKTLVHGYYAGVSYADAQVGKLIAALDELELAENTVVVLWGDHGFHLGDHGIWTKHTNFEQATRIPLLFAGPGVPSGAATGQLAESVDVFPTLAELCDLPAPRGPQPIDGVSLVPVLKDPAARVRDHAYHIYPKQRLGRAIRTDRYRLVEWIDQRSPDAPALLELYDYEEDPLETQNLAEERPQVVERLRATLADYPEPLKPGETPPQAAAKPVPPMSRAEVAAGLKSHNRALHLTDGWIRDPFIARGPDGTWFLTGTTPNPGEPRERSDPFNNGLGPDSLVGWKARVWESDDLIDWRERPVPYTLKDGVWPAARPKRFEAVPQRQWRLWAPELHWLPADTAAGGPEGRWALVHTSPDPVNGANLSLSAGPEVAGPWTNPLGPAIGRRHDPSLFRDDDGRWWMVWGATTIQQLKPDFTGFVGEPVRIGPSGETAKMGHEGCLIRKINDQYVLFGTGWSTGSMRKGSYNLYYAVADEVTGPYGPRQFVGRFLGHGTPFQDDDGRWWCTAFYNADVPPLEPDGVATRDLSAVAQTINRRGTTLVPLEVGVDDDGELSIRAKDPRYAEPGPDEAQQFAVDG